MKTRFGYGWLATGALLLAGCSQGYDAAMESAGNETAAPAVAADGTPAETAADPSAQPPEANGKLPDVNSSGPVGKALLAPTDALD